MMRFKHFIEDAIKDMTEDPKVMLDFPRVRQSANFTCGAAALQSVLAYYGKDFPERVLTQKLGTDREDGTDYERIAKFAIKCGLRTFLGSLEFSEIQRAIDKRWPVILAIQAYADKTADEYEDGYENGHYVVVIGYDKSGLYFADPVMYHRGYLSYEECAKRWHDKDKSEKLQNLGIIITGTPKFDNDAAKRIE